MTEETIAEELLRRRDELNFDREHWVQGAPRPGEQCLVDQRIDYDRPLQALRIGTRRFVKKVWCMDAIEVNDDHGQDEVIAKLDEAIAIAKDLGI